MATLISVILIKIFAYHNRIVTSILQWHCYFLVIELMDKISNSICEKSRSKLAAGEVRLPATDWILIAEDEFDISICHMSLLSYTKIQLKHQNSLQYISRSLNQKLIRAYQKDPLSNVAAPNFCDRCLIFYWQRASFNNK